MPKLTICKFPDNLKNPADQVFVKMNSFLLMSLNLSINFAYLSPLLVAKLTDGFSYQVTSLEVIVALDDNYYSK